MKKFISLTLTLMLLGISLFSLASCGEMKAKPFEANVTVNTEGHSLHYVEIVFKDYGTVSLTLDATVAPITVENFLKLANSGYYNNTYISRVSEGFVIQNNTGAGTDCIKGEFSSNGIENDLIHKKGIISMARNGLSMNSASDQFFIMLGDSPHLDGDYAAFGWVTAGMNIVEALANDIPAKAIKDDMGFLYEQYMPLIEAVRVTGNNGVPSPSTKSVPPAAEPFQPYLTVDTEGHTLHTVEMSIKNYGKITMVLDETVAPITVQNFLKLVNEGYYNGLSITRVQTQFVAQMGDGAGTESIKGEFSSNGVPNLLSHRKGILSMARTPDKDSASDQFFIMLYGNMGLDGSYAAFGWVTSGMNILEYIENNIMFHHYTEDASGYEMGFLKEEYQPVIEYIKVVE
ncbi:MAG: peptidylprolyl isomerase [Clostridia bacterium]|nr:peptidylprolyl isomerase [Clostridia bacterium]